MTDGAHPPILPTEWHHDLAHVPPNIDLFIRLIVLTWRFSGRMMTGLRTDILKLLTATVVSSENCLWRPVLVLRIHDGMPCHPECRAVNKAVKRTNKRIMQKKLVSESLEDDDPQLREDVDNADEEARDDEAEDEQRVKAKRNYNGRTKFEVIKK